MKTFVIHCCAGSGGLFLTTLFAQIMGLNVRANFSQTGNAHDMGLGPWKGAKNVCFVGLHWKLNYRPGFPLYYSHTLPAGFIEQNPNVNIIKIDTDTRDYKKVTELYVYKAWSDMWTPQEYAKWASPEYPPYSRSNIQDSELIRNDLIKDLEVTNIKPWHERNACVPACARINFRTIMGIDQQDLVDNVCGILQCSANSTVRDYVAQYQTINKQLYFKDYV